MVDGYAYERVPNLKWPNEYLAQAIGMASLFNTHHVGVPLREGAPFVGVACDWPQKEHQEHRNPLPGLAVWSTPGSCLAKPRYAWAMEGRSANRVDILLPGGCLFCVFCFLGCLVFEKAPGALPVWGSSGKPTQALGDATPSASGYGARCSRSPEKWRGGVPVGFLNKQTRTLKPFRGKRHQLRNKGAPTLSKDTPNGAPRGFKAGFAPGGLDHRGNHPTLLSKEGFTIRGKARKESQRQTMKHGWLKDLFT